MQKKKKQRGRENKYNQMLNYKAHFGGNVEPM